VAAANLANSDQAFELHITRTFDAPRDLVWDVWTDAAHARHWMGPRPYPAIAFEQDARVGGKWSLTLKGIEDGRVLTQRGVFQEITPKEKVVYTLRWDESHPAHGPDMLVTVTFKDEGKGKTRMDFRQQGLPSKEERDGHEEGWGSAFDRFDDLITVSRKAGDKIVWLYPEDDPVILASRLFNAPRELLWECFTKAEHMVKWWGANKYEGRVEKYDVRVGGEWAIKHIAKEESDRRWEDDGVGFKFFGKFLELKRPELFIWTFGFKAPGIPDMPPAEEIYSFTDIGGKTLLVSLSRYPDLESRDGMRETDMESGAEETYERLDALLNTLR
jgi:uncharacterized protein YndB with AHSA1/START domain